MQSNTADPVIDRMVEIVSGQGMSDKLHMDTNLMGSSGFQL